MLLRRLALMNLSQYKVLGLGTLPITQAEDGLSPSDLSTIRSDCADGSVNITMFY